MSTEIKYVITENDVKHILCGKCKRRFEELIAEKITEQIMRQRREQEQKGR